MSDHIPDTGKMVPGKIAVLREIAAMLDHPSVYMGGPSQRNMRRAEQIYAAVAPLIAKAERERCIAAGQKAWPKAHTYASENADMYRAQDHAAATVLAVIRALGDADE